ncbi:MAG: hypothetical protein ACE366_04050 [Bradymonadia bacterium]
MSPLTRLGHLGWLTCGDGPFEVISVLLIAPGGDAFCPPEAEVCERVCEVQGGFGQSGP